MARTKKAAPKDADLFEGKQVDINDVMTLIKELWQAAVNLRGSIEPRIRPGLSM